MTVYTLFGQPALGLNTQSDTSTYTMGMQFTLSQSAVLSGIWFYSGIGAHGLPVGCAIYRMTGAGAGSIVAGSENDSPSWSGAAASGWVKCSYGSGPTLAASTVYKVVFLKDATENMYAFTSHYWDSGAGASGLTSGIITAPNNAGADGGQNTFVSPSTSLTYPASSFNATNYWVDVEVTASASSAVTAPGCLAASGALVHRRRRRARGYWRGLAQAASGVPSFTVGWLTSWTSAGIAVLGLLDETGSAVIDEAGSFILNEDGS